MIERHFNEKTIERHFKSKDNYIWIATRGSLLEHWHMILNYYTVIGL